MSGMSYGVPLVYAGRGGVMIDVLVTGAAGKMGALSAATIAAQDDLRLVALVDPRRAAAGEAPCFKDVEEALALTSPAAALEFSVPGAVFDNSAALLEAGVPTVVGATGLDDDQVADLSASGRGVRRRPRHRAQLRPRRRAADAVRRRGGEVLRARRDHRDARQGQADAPSGTRLRTARLMAEAPGSALAAPPGAGPASRGLVADGRVTIHSVRLPGVVAHQEVLFGGDDELLTLRHDSLSRRSFMSGVLLALRRVGTVHGTVVGLENLLDCPGRARAGAEGGRVSRSLGTILTAMVTPFDADLAVDHDKLAALAEHLIAHGSDGLVVAGTTGESPTLDDAEKLAMFRTVVEAVDGRVPVVAGTGTNDTRHSVELTRAAEACGVDAVLAVAPYYNKPPERGLIAHFRAVAAATSLPLIVYNIPGRCVVNLSPEALAELGEVDNIVAVKQANPDLAETRPAAELSDLASTPATTTCCSTSWRAAGSAASAWPATWSGRGWPRSPGSAGTATSRPPRPRTTTCARSTRRCS